MLFQKKNETETNGSVVEGNIEERLNNLLKENAELKETLYNAEVEKKILAYGEKLNVKDLAESMISDNSVENFESALIKLVDASIEKQENLEESFEETSSATVGVSSDKEEELEFSSINDAINGIAKRDGISKTDALEVVKNEFPELFKKQYNK